MLQIKIANNKGKLFAHNLTQTNMKGYIERYWGGWKEEIFGNNYDLGENYLVVMEDNPIGYLRIRFAANECWIEDIQIKEDYQNRGIGSWVLKNALLVAERKGCESMKLRVLKENPAKRLYNRFGFVQISDDESSIIMKKDL
ncbi:MAG: GNAT family N-acetyltransferase [Candidatus Hodarchaeota archaeon]